MTNKKTFPLLGAFALLALFYSFVANKPRHQPPNVLFIAVDDLRPELNFYGATHIQSPHLDQLAGESLVFNRAYCNVPVCGASRVSLLTGARPTRFRYLNARTAKDEDNPNVPSLPMLLKQKGYRTISNGKIYHHQKDDSLAWDEVWNPDRKYAYATKEYQEIRANTYRGMPMERAVAPDSAYRDGKLAMKAMRDLQKLKLQDDPFFLAVGFYKPHLPFTAPQKYWDLYNREDIQLPENYLQPASTPKKAFHRFGELRNYETIPKDGDLEEAMAKELIHGYYACVSYIDAQIGLILAELERLALAENTIVILWGDHGWNLGDHKLWCKHCTFASSLRVPLILKVPGKTNGKKTDDITEFIDIYPSICDLTGIEKPPHLEGESFAMLVKGGKREKDFAVSKFNDAVTLIQGSYFYTEWTDKQGVPYARMLFDHETDPLELDNLAEKESYSTVVEKLAKELRNKWGKDFLQP